MTPQLIDTHAHLDYPDFAPDLDALLGRAGEAGVTRIVSIGTSLESSHRAVALAERHPMIRAVAGWHPNEAAEAPADLRPALRELAKNPRVVALGETGIDYFRLPPGPEAEALKLRQEDLFRQHLEVAAETGLNVVVHQREAFDQTLQLFRPFANRVRAVFHCFVGTPEQMREVVAMGSLVSFTGIATFKNAQTIRDTLGAVPANAFMVETDCPFLAPVPHRGRRCEPAHVVETARLAASVRGIEYADLCRETTATAEAFFRNLMTAA